MLTAINNALNDHQFMNTAINYLGAFGMICGMAVICLSAFYPSNLLRRKR